MIELSPKTRSHLATLFDPSDVRAAEAILVTRCGGQLPGMANASSEDLERIRFAALRVSNGRLRDLGAAVNLAQADWRDLLVAAGFADDPASHHRWTPRISKADFYRGKVVAKVLWYLHDPDLPAKLNWARLRVFSDGSADSTFADGPLYGFDNEAYAGYILTEDEYVCFSTFDDEDERDTGIRTADIVPPDWSDAPDRPFEYLGIY
jgi:hypothetical protein